MLRKLENAYEQQNVPIQEPVQTAQPRATEASTVAAPGRINLLKNDKIIVTDANDIYYACAQEKVTRVFTRHEEYTMPMSISEFHARLPQQDFFRCHRSYTVNLSQIREIVPWFNHTYLLRLRGLEAEIPVSRSKAKEFRQIMRL